MKFEVFAHTDKGLRRESNQDSYLVNDDLGLYIVADGMGGHSGGEVASALAVKTVESFIQNNVKKMSSPKDLLQKAVECASETIFDHAQEETRLLGMGTTMVAVYAAGRNIYIANVGDSRAYMFRAPLLWQVTEDHSLINEQLRAGIMNEDQAKHFVGRNVITRSVGYERNVQPEMFERQVQLSDSFLLCSDGLSGLVGDDQISATLAVTRPEDVVYKCVEQALAAGGDDNVTVMYICAKNV
jgi:serine/threonine protein phosphatase PrpC